MANYSGLTRNTWTGTWSPTGDHPIVLDTEIRGALQSISGDSGDQLTDIPGQRISEGMLVYVKNGYGLVTGDRYYKYQLLSGESRNVSTGAVPNNDANWSEVTFGGGGGGGAASVTITDTAPTGSSVGDLWWDTTEGQLYIFYDDYWVQAAESIPQLPDTFSGDYNDLINKPNIPSGSADISALNDFTSSIQIQVDNLTAETGSYLTSLPNGVVSGSAQITDVITDSYISASAAASGFGAVSGGGGGAGSGITAWMVLQSDYALTVNPSFNIHQKIFNVGANGNGSFNLETGVYRYTGQLYLSNMATGLETFQFDGTATINSMLRLINNRKTTTLTTAGFSQQTVQLGGLSQAATPNTSGVNVWLELEGIIDVSSAGTVIPQIRLGGTSNPSAQVNAGSFFTITRVGDTGGSYGGDVD